MKALVIGAGSIARRHLRNLRHLPPVTQIAVMTTRGRALDPQELGADTVLGSLEQALEWRPERVVVASPAPWHLLQSRPFAEAGIPVLIEKPLAHDWAETEAHSHWLNRHAAQLSVGYNLRYLPSARFMKAFVDQGLLEGLTSVHIEVGQYLPDWRPGTDYRTQVSSQRALGGGAILELSHEIDLLHWLFGPAQGVYCRARQSGQLDVDVEDTVDALFTLRSGVSASMHLDFLQRVRVRQIRLIGVQGTVRWDLARDQVDCLGPDSNVLLFSSTSDDPNALYLEQLQDFVLSGRCAATVDEARQVMFSIDTMKRSAALPAYLPMGSMDG